MIRIALLLWVLFFIILAFSMMPTAAIFAVIGGAVGGVISAIIKHKEKKKEKPNFELYEWKNISELRVLNVYIIIEKYTK